jgi:hypothetical protein
LDNERPRDTTRREVKKLLRLVCAIALTAAASTRVTADELFPPTPVRTDPGTADSDAGAPKVGWAIGAGALTALVPFAVGASLFASNFDVDRRTAASLVMAYGMALAPVVSHLVAKEWSRAAIFGAIPLACAVGITVLVEVQPTVTFYGTREGRWAYGLLLSATTLSAGIGVADVLGARGRWKERRQQRRAKAPIVPSPFFTSGGGGVTVGGLF